MSSAENALEFEVIDQKLFIFGGINTMNKLVNDEGYHMFDIRENNMYHVKISNQSQ